MAVNVTLLVDKKINGDEYKKGDKLKVCDELAKQLIDDKEAKAATKE